MEDADRDWRAAWEAREKAAGAYFALLPDMVESDAERFATEDEVLAALDKEGVWQHVYEWRISTETTLTIRRVAPHESDWDEAFEATAECAYHLSSTSPTLGRAMGFLVVYQELIQRLFYDSGLGWPTWRGPREL